MDSIINIFSSIKDSLFTCCVYPIISQIMLFRIPTAIMYSNNKNFCTTAILKLLNYNWQNLTSNSWFALLGKVWNKGKTEKRDFILWLSEFYISFISSVIYFTEMGYLFVSSKSMKLRGVVKLHFRSQQWNENAFFTSTSFNFSQLV